MLRIRILSAALVGLLLAAAPALAEVKLPAVFSDHMVLQREQPIPVWGWDKPGTEVTVKLAGSEAKAKADENGKWLVKLTALKAGGPHELTVTGSSTVSKKDILVGEVWLCSGQSNMEWTVRSSKDAQTEITGATNARIRHIKIPHVQVPKAQDDVATKGWEVCDSQTVGNFTAVGYFFAREISKDLDVPVGLIGSNWGGTRIEPWIAPEGLKELPNLKLQSASGMYNGMIHPLVPYGIRGTLWYQGESNNGEGMLYYEKMKALIDGWRSVWGNKDMPFYFVQLAPYKYGGDPTRLAGIWEAQQASLAIPHTGMAVTVDISTVGNIHPPNKQDVGKRLALWALAKTYGRSGIVYSGPLYKSMKVEGNKVRITFDHAGGGLVARDGKALTWFTIAGDDKKFVEAKAEIDGNSIVVSADSIAKPTQVRFAYHQEAEPNLSNKEGLPAGPFRTDKD